MKEIYFVDILFLLIISLSNESTKVWTLTTFPHHTKMAWQFYYTCTCKPDENQRSMATAGWQSIYIAWLTALEQKPRERTSEEMGKGEYAKNVLNFHIQFSRQDCLNSLLLSKITYNQEMKYHTAKIFWGLKAISFVDFAVSFKTGKFFCENGGMASHLAKLSLWSVKSEF